MRKNDIDKMINLLTEEKNKLEQEQKSEIANYYNDMLEKDTDVYLPVITPMNVHANFNLWFRKLNLINAVLEDDNDIQAIKIESLSNLIYHHDSANCTTVDSILNIDDNLFKIEWKFETLMKINSFEPYVK
mgnify:CR=1 FL=1